MATHASNTAARTSATLLMRIRDPRDAEAWSELDRIYRPLLMRFARMKGLDDADADDVVQHCMKAVHEKIKTFDYDPSGSFRSWLRRIAKNYIINQRAKRREERADTAMYAGAAANDPGPDEEFDRIWRQEHLRRAYELLEQEVAPEKFGPFNDHFRREISVDDTCRKWNITPNTLYQIKFKLSRRLAEILRELTGADAD